MPGLDPIAAQLRKQGARVLAFDRTGAHTVAIPVELSMGEATVVECASPLDPLDPGSHADAVVAFEQARRTGHGATTVRLAGDTDQFNRLDIVDLGPPHGPFLAVLTEGADHVERHGTEALPPRRAGFVMSATGVIVSIDDDFTEMLGWTANEVVGTSSLELIHPDDHENGIVAWVELLESPGGRSRLRQRFKHRSGDWLWCEVTDTNHLDDPMRPGVVGELLDVSRELAAQQALQRRETLLNRLTQALPTGVLQLDADGVAVVWNERWRDLTGLDPADGLDCLAAMVADGDALIAAVERATTDGADADLEVALAGGRGICQYGELHLRALRVDGEVAGLLVTLDDVTSLRSYQQELAEQARRDPLTGLLNRLGIEDVVIAHLDNARRRPEDTGLVVLFADLDRFKAVNDTFGHLVGDEVLSRVAASVAALLRPTDALGRIGGDEFLAVVDAASGSPDPANLADRMVAAVAEVSAEFAERLDAPVGLGVSVGIAVADADDDFDSLMKKADGRMYEQKRSNNAARP